jgi:hypothetical protein
MVEGLEESVEVTGETVEADKKSLWDKFMDTMKKELQDLSYIEIITAAGDPKSDVDPENNARDLVDALRSLENVRALARTRIELDGDIGMILPTGEGGSLTINYEILNIHKENVAVAVANWNSFVQNLLTVLDMLVSIGRGTPPRFREAGLSPITSS